MLRIHKTQTVGMSTDQIMNVCKNAIGGAEGEILCMADKELEQGLEFTKQYPKMVTIFGSARTKPEDPYYQKTVSLAAKIVKATGAAITTGGGPGIMEAGNKGATEAAGTSVAMTIKLPHEQNTNPFATKEVGFNFFFSRKFVMMHSTDAFVYFPGGFGTLDEFFDLLTLVQTGKFPKVPIFLVGVEFWSPLQAYIKEFLAARELISHDDIHLYTITDDEALIVNTIQAHFDSETNNEKKPQ